MDLSLIANVVGGLLGGGSSSGSGSGGGAGTWNSPGTDSINIPGTIMGNLQNVASTGKFLQNQARYNNYMTDNYGAAQMASDRYMSMKERIPMSIEYYLTPSEKKEVVLYINPNKINMSTQKVKAKVFTRGGIYFHHYGDDVWTLDITGETGLSQMKGIEALEEVYHYSGTLLKYQNVDVSTVHTNNIASATSGSSRLGGGLFDSILDSTGLNGLAGKAKDYLNNKVLGTFSDVVGGGFGGGITGGIFGEGTKMAGGIGGALIQGIGGAAADSFGQQVYAGAISGITGALTGVGNGNIGGAFKDVASGLGGALKGFSKDVVGNLAADMVLGAFGIGGSTSGSIEKLSTSLNSGIDSIVSLLGGGNKSSGGYTLPNQATQGNFYTMGHMTASQLEQMVSSVQTTNAQRRIDHQQVAARWSDIEDNLTDLYRPRQLFIYFDDRVFIGHFDQFVWTKVATTKSISYTMKFTVTRQVKVGRRSGSSASYSGGSLGGGLKNILTGAGLGMIGGALGGLFGGSSKSAVQSGTSMNSNSGGYLDVGGWSSGRDDYRNVNLYQPANNNWDRFTQGGNFF